MQATAPVCAVSRQDKPSFFLTSSGTGPDAVLEVAASDARCTLASLPAHSGSVIALGVSTTSSGLARLGILRDTWTLEVWDVSGSYRLTDAIQLPSWKDRGPRGGSGGGGASRGTSMCMCGSGGLSSALFVMAPQGQGATVQVVRAYPSLAVGYQRLDASDSSRKKQTVVFLAHHPSRPFLGVAFSDSLIMLFDTSRSQEAASSGPVGLSGGGDDASVAGGGTDDAEETASAQSTAQLLLLPVACLRLDGQAVLNPLTCVAFCSGLEMVAAGTQGGWVVVWNISTVREGQGLSSSDPGTLPVLIGQTGAGAGTRNNGSVFGVDFVPGRPLIIAALRDAAEGSESATGPLVDPALGCRSSRVVALAMCTSTLAVVHAGIRMPEATTCVAFNGMAARVMACGAAGWTCVSLKEELSRGLMLPVLAGSLYVPWTTLLGQSQQTQPLSGHYISTSMAYPKDPKKPPLLQSLLIIQGLHSTQKRGDIKGPRSAPSTTPLPTYVSDLRRCLVAQGLDTTVMLSLGPLFGSHGITSQQESETLLLPSQLHLSADAACTSIMVFFDIAPSRRLLQSSAASTLDHQSMSGIAGRAYGALSASVFVLYRRVLAPSGEGRDISLVLAGAAADAAFLSPRHLALLNENGNQVTLWALDGDPNLPTSTWRRVSETTLDCTVRRVMPAPEGLGGRPVAALYVLHLSLGERLTYTGRALAEDEVLDLSLSGFAKSTVVDSGRDALAMSRVDGLMVGVGGEQPTLVLRDGEAVLQSVWQVGIGPPGANAQAALPLLAVLTTMRVLLVSSDLIVLSETSPTEQPQSVAWLGPVLAHNLPSGHVQYLHVTPKRHCEAGVICTLDQRHAVSQARIVALLPDRLVYAVNVRATGGVRLITRPLMPLEPLVIGTLSLQLLGGEDGGSHEAKPLPGVSLATQALLKTVVERYGPKEGKALNEGPGRNAGATTKAVVALCQAGLFDLAATVAGVASDVSAAGAEVFRRRPWVPVELKAGIAAARCKWREAMLEQLAEDPAAQEYALNPDSIRNATLPLRGAAVGRVLEALGSDAKACGQGEAALRLYDASGNDDDVITLLTQQALAEPLGHATQLIRELLGVRAEPYLRAYIGMVLPATIPKGSPAADVSTALSPKLSSLLAPLDAARRSTLLPSSGHELSSWPIATQTHTLSDLAMHHVGPESNMPPRIPLLGRLLLDRVDEWLGRHGPEVIEDEAGPLSTVVEAAAGEGDDWVKGVGQGREDEENVVGYWRFSEMTAAPEPSTTPSTGQRLFGDLSAYAHPMEVVVDQPGAVVFEPSTSAVDSGDEAKVRPAYDVVYSNADMKTENGRKTCRGLVMRVKRGSALDVGPYHVTASNRTKVTVEMWVQRPEQQQGAEGSGIHVLLVRMSENESTRIWVLGVMADGSMVFRAGDEDGVGASEVRSAAGVVEPGRWTHVAATMDVKGKSGAIATVVLFTGGREQCTGQVKFPTLSEQRLRSTLFFVGPNLRAYRLTELRIWALAKSADDLYDMRESYLKLAEKRKRLAFKIKAGFDGNKMETPVMDAPAVTAAVPQPLTQPQQQQDGLAAANIPAMSLGGIALAASAGAAARRRRSLAPEASAASASTDSSTATVSTAEQPPVGLGLNPPPPPATRARRNGSLSRKESGEKPPPSGVGSLAGPGPGTLPPPGGTSGRKRVSMPPSKLKVEDDGSERDSPSIVVNGRATPSAASSPSSTDTPRSSTPLSFPPGFTASPIDGGILSSPLAWDAFSPVFNPSSPTPDAASVPVTASEPSTVESMSKEDGQPVQAKTLDACVEPPRVNVNQSALAFTTSSSEVTKSAATSSIQPPEPPVTPKQPQEPPSDGPAGDVTHNASLLLSLRDFKVDPSVVLRDSRAPVLSFGGHQLCVLEQQLGTGKMGISVVTVATKSYVRYPFQAQSAIVNGDPQLPLIACYSLTTPAADGPGVLSVYDLENRKGIARQPTHTQVCFWRWQSLTHLALVTPRAVFLWAGSKGGTPVKLFDRTDTESLPVRDYQSAKNGQWGVLVTGTGVGDRKAQIYCIEQRVGFVEEGVVGLGLGHLPSDPDKLFLIMLRVVAESGCLLEMYVVSAGDGPGGLPSARVLSSSSQRIACHALPNVKVTAEQDAWVLFPCRGKRDVTVVVREDCLVYMYHPDTGLILANRRAMSKARDVCRDAQGDLLIFEEKSAAVYKVTCE